MSNDTVTTQEDETMTWRNLVTYPQCVDAKAAALLDTIVGLLPVPSGDRYVAMSSWLRAAHEAGIITGGEHFGLRSEIAPNM